MAVRVKSLVELILKSITQLGNKSVANWRQRGSPVIGHLRLVRASRFASDGCVRLDCANDLGDDASRVAAVPPAAKLTSPMPSMP